MKPDELLENEDGRMVSQALARLREARAEEQASPSTEERLLNEFRQVHQAAGKRAALAVAARRRSTWRPAFYFALAALLLVASGFVVGLVLRGDQPEQTQLPTAAALKRIKDVPKAERTPEAVSNETKGALEAQSKPNHPRRKTGATKVAAARTGRPPRPSAGPTPALAGTPARFQQEGAFIPTMVPVGTESDYGLQLVRMELPRKTMVSFGLRVDPRQLGRPVKADLIIGPDGLTRAIRFVDQ